MMTATSRLTAAETLTEIERLGISLTGWPGLRIWLASVERVKSKKRFTKANMEIISAIAATPMLAVEALLEKLKPYEQLELEDYLRDL